MLSIGRVVIGAADAVPAGVVTVTDFSSGPDGLTINGAISTTDQTKASAAMQRLLGLIESQDESVVPLVWPDGPEDIGGFYRVTGGAVTGNAGIFSRGVPYFSLTLARVGGFTAPEFESIVQGGKRANSASGITPQAYVALPAATRGFEIGTDLTPSRYTRTADQGDMYAFYNAGNTLFDATPAFFTPPEAWYDGASTLKVGGEVTVGRQVRNLPLDWQLSNGLLRLTPVAGGSKILVERFSASSWATVGTIEPGMNNGPGGALGDLPAPHTLTVMRNSPQAASIRLTMDLLGISGTGYFAVTLDIALRRGSRMAALRMASRGPYTYRFDLAGYGSTIGTALTGGWTSATGTVVGQDADWTGGFTSAAGKPSTTRRLLGGANSRLILGYGWSPTTTAGFDEPQALINQWAAEQSENINAVLR